MGTHHRAPRLHFSRSASGCTKGLLMSARASVTLHHPHSHALAVASLFMRACRRHRSQADSDLVCCREGRGAGADGGKISRDFRDHSFSTDHIARAQLVTVQRVRVCVDCVHSCSCVREKEKDPATTHLYCGHREDGLHHILLCLPSCDIW